MIASGPAYPDSSTTADALAIIQKYQLKLSDQAMQLMQTALPASLDNVETVVTGSVRQLCRAASEQCERLGIESRFLTASLSCEAREAGRFLAAIGQGSRRYGSPHRVYPRRRNRRASDGAWQGRPQPGAGARGGRRNRRAFERRCLLRRVRTGTDGPTDAAGGYVDGATKAALDAQAFPSPTCWPITTLITRSSARTA